MYSMSTTLLAHYGQSKLANTLRSKYGNFLTSLIVTLTVGGFAVTGSINGGQCLAAVVPNTLSVEGAISIIMCISLVIGFMGYRVMHLFTRWAWIPSLL